MGKKPNQGLLPLLPLRDIVIFPHMMVPLYVGRAKSIRAVEEAMRGDRHILLCAQKKAKTNEPEAGDIYPVGTVSQIMQHIRRPDGTVKVLVEGKQRARVDKFLTRSPFFLVEATALAEQEDLGQEIDALQRTVREVFDNYARLSKRLQPDVVRSIHNVKDPARLGDAVVAHLPLKHADKQTVLEMLNPRSRLEKLYELMQAEIEILQVERKIRGRVKKQMERSEREYYLNEQMRAIQKELGDRDELKNEIAELEDTLKSKPMPDEARARAEKEVKKLKMMAPMSAEATVVRNYIDWLLGLPWDYYTEDKLDLSYAENVLDEDHYALQKPKERILEYLAVQKLVDRVKGPILCLVGPPGVGKTSLARSIARATGRKFVRQSLGGVRDEAEIRGHRRTYIGALPGKIIQSLKRAESSNPVFLLDEIDKMSMDFRGDPSAALLEVLDPEQNSSFVDHYLDLDYDLSKVMFICTANSMEGIPMPLEDRLEVIRIAGYTPDEKLAIAKKYLIPKQCKQNGLTNVPTEWPESGIKSIIELYTREAGVRTLEREVASICRKLARDVVSSGDMPEAPPPDTDTVAEGDTVEVASETEEETEAETAAPKPYPHKFRLIPSKIKKLLGVPKYRTNKREERSDVGLATGLAWTQMGGDILQIEVTLMPGKGKLLITGKLGDVMQESAQAAMSYVRSRAESWGLKKDFYADIDIHVHVPEGAIPKDGPSAGITIATALVSALTKIPVRHELAMTGEITLRGRVLPIGGLKEKALAAHRANIKDVLIPKDNEKDLEDIPPQVAKVLNFIIVEHMDQVLRHALELSDGDSDVLFASKSEVGDHKSAGAGAHAAGASKPSAPH